MRGEKLGCRSQEKPGREGKRKPWLPCGLSSGLSSVHPSGSVFHFIIFSPSSPPPSPLPMLRPPFPSGSPDEVYAQKMKYKAISEELDNALNDITSL